MGWRCPKVSDTCALRATAWWSAAGAVDAVRLRPCYPRSLCECGDEPFAGERWHGSRESTKRCQAGTQEFRGVVGR